METRFESCNTNLREPQKPISSWRKIIKDRLYIVLGASLFAHGAGIATMSVAADDMEFAERTEQKEKSPVSSKFLDEFIQVLPKQEQETVKKAAEEVVEEKDVRQQRVDELSQERELHYELVRKHGVGERSILEFVFDDDVVTQGVSSELIPLARRNFEGNMTSFADGAPNFDDQKTILQLRRLLAPNGSYNDFSGITTQALALGLSKDTQNCTVRTDVFAAAFDYLRPGERERILVQEFKEHSRVLYRTSNDDIYIVEGSVSIFPDKIARRRQSRIMTYDDYRRYLAGEDEKTLKSLVYYGEQSSLEKSKMDPTDEFINRIDPPSTSSDKPVDVYRSRSRSPESFQRALQAFRNNNRHIQNLLRPMEVEIRSTELSSEMAEKLIQQPSEDIRTSPFYLIESLKDVETAKVVSKYSGDILALTDLTTLTVKQAKELSNFNGQVIHFDRIEILDSEALRAMAKFSGKISLGQLKLTPELAKVIATFSAKYLRVEVPSSTSLEVFNNLAQFSGNLYINGLEEITVELAEVFATYQSSSLSLNTSSKDTSGGIKEIPLEAVEQLKKYDKEMLSILLDVPLTSEIASILKDASSDVLHIGANDQNLSVESARLLSQFKGKQIGVSRLKKPSPEVAEALAGFSGKTLFITDADSFSKEAFYELSRFPGKTLVFHGIKLITSDITSGLEDFQAANLNFMSIERIEPDSLAFFQKKERSRRIA